jgi:DNA-binding NtrC family response regulator
VKILRVLIVEDEVQILLLAESALQEAGHETLSAGTLSDAQAIIADPSEKLDLVFTDIELHSHKDGGIALGKFVKASRSGVPVLYTSGRPVTAEMELQFAGQSLFLHKPYSPSQLRRRIMELLEK